LNIIDLGRVAVERPQIVRDLPNGGGRLGQLARGYVATMVAGEVTYREGLASGALPGRLISLLAAAEVGLVNLDEMTRGVASMEIEMQGMRQHLVDVIAVLEGVNGGVAGMSGSVVGIRDATVSLDSQIDGLQDSLKNIDILAARLTRFPGSRRARALKRELAKEPESA